MAPSNLLTEWSKLLFASFADAGVRDVVVSPGSRSTPLVAAAVREERLTCHLAIDERAAAFFALGQARVTGRPSVLVCTSGTAGAHYFPALLEAEAAFVPMIVLTADRPLELQHCAAPQTIDQVKLFGDHVRRFFDLGAPDASLGSLRALRRLAAQAVFATTSPEPGAVHVNARARKPLEPALATDDEGRALAASVEALARGPIAAPAPPQRAPDAGAVREVADACKAASRGLILCGPAPASQARGRDALFALAAATGFPLVAEATSQLRFGAPPAAVVVVDAFDALLRAAAFRARALPDLVLHVGVPLVSGGWERFAASTRARHVVLTEHGWSDPHSLAEVLLFGEPAGTARALVEALGPAPGPGAAAREWARSLAEANAAAWQAIDRELAHDALTEGHVARAVAEAAPRASVLVVGNSLAVRAVDTFCKQGAGPATVLSQRGVSGIDGLIAGAAGASTKSASPVTLLLGDVSFLHDLTSLSLARAGGPPLVVVVLQNFGGRIFEQLPIAGAPGIEAQIMDLTLTPHARDLSHAASLFGVAFARARTREELGAALAAAYARAGCTVVEAVVAEHAAAEQARRITAAIERALSSAPP